MKKRILKRIGFSLVTLSSLLLGTACLNPSNAQDVLFYKSTVHGRLGWISVYDPVAFDFENKKYRFESDSQDILHLKSADGKTDYLSFIPYKENNIDARLYFVKKIYTSNPNLQFLEISVREAFETVGYWLIGKYNNNWVIYISANSLKTMGLSDGGFIHSEVNPNLNGKMILDINAYDPDPIRIELYWDNTMNQIKMKKETINFFN